MLLKDTLFEGVATELIIKPCPLAARICCTFSPTSFSSVQFMLVWNMLVWDMLASAAEHDAPGRQPLASACHKITSLPTFTNGANTLVT